MLIIFSASSLSWAVNMNYNRPNPLMDYAPQEIGIYDTNYQSLTESDCRGCHGDNLAERHHATPLVATEHRCIVCHEVISTGVSVIRDCTTSGCHSNADLGTNGWHHNTDASGSSNCVACHSPNLISEITPIRDISLYPPSVVTPTPFSCENCHWEQTVSGGHPSTLDHFNEQGEDIGFYEYGKPIAANYNTHHMGGQGNVYDKCYQCHAQNPYSPNWDPFDQLAIRYCEVCHSVDSLHRIGPHVQNTNGWKAVGFHTEGATDPDDYTDFDPTGYGTFIADQQCSGCHVDLVDVVLPPPITPPGPPAIDTEVEGIQPNHACCGTVVTLRGTNFGEQKGTGYKVQLEDISGWIDMPVHAWTDNLIEFEIPCWTLLGPGNFNVQVVTPVGTSNHRVFTLEDCIPPYMISNPDQGPANTVIKVSSDNNSVGGFGSHRSEIYDDDSHGVCRIVDFVSSQGTYTAVDYLNWSNTSFEVKFYNFFKDSGDPETGHRNYVQDPGEPSIVKASGLAVGKWAMYLKYIYFYDADHTHALSAGDTIFQVVASAPLYFELTNKAPIVYQLTPTRINTGNTVQIYGLNFGQSQGNGEVRIGSKEEAASSEIGEGMLLENIRSWSSTLIKVKMDDLPPEWVTGYKYIWVEKGGKSEYMKIKILGPHI